MSGFPTRAETTTNFIIKKMTDMLRRQWGDLPSHVWRDPYVVGYMQILICGLLNINSQRQPSPRSGVGSTVEPTPRLLAPGTNHIVRAMLVSPTCKDTRPLATSQSPYRPSLCPTTLRCLLGADAVAICDSVV